MAVTKTKTTVEEIARFKTQIDKGIAAREVNFFENWENHFSEFSALPKEQREEIILYLFETNDEEYWDLLLEIFHDDRPHDRRFISNDDIHAA